MGVLFVDVTDDLRARLAELIKKISE